MHIGTVIATNDTQVTNDNGTVYQKVDACIAIELLGTRLTAIVFMITQAGIDGCCQTTELLCHTLLI